MTSAQRARLRTAANLLRALIPLAALVIVVVVLTWPRGGQQGGPAIVDPGPVIDQARSMAPYTLLAPAQSGPAALPTGWRATSARIDAPGAGGAPAGAFA
ncbi:MAG: DUF4245 domain-containing protein, partial [Frankiaceae bacterium]|nr:DUF4245 domain-containing protein [Frankiaceae bacterium]